MFATVCIPQSVYKSPRALLIEYLNDRIDPDVAWWVVKNSSFEFDIRKLNEVWKSLVRPTLGESYDEVSWIYFTRHIYSSSSSNGRAHRGFWPRTLITKSWERRWIVNDLKKGPLYEWMIRFLLEQSRVDWIDWIDKDERRFCIYDMAGMGAMYAKVHKTIESSSLYHIKLILSSYCLCGILKQIDKKDNHYQFDNDWYQKEVIRTEIVTLSADNIDFYDNPFIIDSYLNFPEQTALQFFH